MGVKAAVAGASGFAGGELLRLLSGHPDIEVTTVSAHDTAGKQLGDIHPHLPELADLVISPTSPEVFDDVDLVLLAVPAGQAASLATNLSTRQLIVDLSPDHRLVNPVDHARYYHSPHQGSWIAGIPELPGQREKISSAARVSIPGCHATAAILALAPLTAAGVVSAEDVMVTSVTGTSGAGRSPRNGLFASEVMGDVTAYQVGIHRHVPEIQQLAKSRQVTFTPILAPLSRGIFTTVTAHRATKNVDVHTIRDALATAYANETFVRLLPTDQWPHSANVLGSNACQLQATLDSATDRVIVGSVIDNLGKGAAGQALQCANLMCGLEETSGLTAHGVAP